MLLYREMREAIKQDTHANFARKFVRDQFHRKENGGEDVPAWVKDALDAAGLSLKR
jgi:queuine tRNA-ribosyltransferase